MLRSLMTAVTGVKAHQVLLDSTGNNIANVNTTGYKRDFTIFQDLLYQTQKGATAPGDARGGVNPAQVGLGVKVGAIETIHTQGYFQYTGNKYDMMIDGEGYFVFRDGGSRIYSRAGNFTLDAEKSLVHSGTGYNVQGYQMIRDPLNPATFIEDGDISDIKIPLGDKLDARGTTLIGYKCNLNSEDDAYLPIGFADIKSNNAGEYVSKEALSPIGANQYELNYNTSTTSTGGGDYFSISIGYPGASGDAAPTKLSFNMVGITQDGYPQLNFTTASGSDTVLNAGAWTGTGAVTAGWGVLADGTTAFKVEYDELDGTLRLVGAGGKTLFSTNLFQKMDYNFFTVGTGTEQPRFIAEFDEFNMDESPMRLTLWWENDTGDGTDPETRMGKAVYDVTLNQDGTFESVALVGTPTGTIPQNYSLTGNNPSLKLEKSEDGKSLEFKAAITAPTDGSIPTLETRGTINQGGQWSTKVTIYDCQGKEYTLEVQFKKITENRWRWEASIPGQELLFVAGENGPASGELVFDDSCHLISPEDSVPISIDFGMNGTSFQSIELDFSGKTFGLDPMQGVTQFASESTTKGYYQDGYTMGVLNDFTVGSNGTINGVYTNGATLPIYRVALAQFANPMGLEKIGDTMFRESVNSGMANINPAQSNGGGDIVGQTLEMSNVDLTEEFTRLIIAQRGFQANTRVVTTSDQILEEVVNLKR